MADTAFLVTLSANLNSASQGSTIVWNFDKYNPGNHYDVTTGMYTVPSAGYYSFSVAKRGNHAHGTVYLIVDGARVAWTDGYNPDHSVPQGTSTVILKLIAGQKVWIENRESNVVYGIEPSGFMWSWFTGYMLFPL